MFSTTLKRSVATLGVVAGLLAAAVPASAGTPGSVPGTEMTQAIAGKAPTNAGTQVGSEGVKDDVPLDTVSFTFKGELIGLEPT